jgi:hypothetical protein
VLDKQLEIAESSRRSTRSAELHLAAIPPKKKKEEKINHKAVIPVNKQLSQPHQNTHTHTHAAYQI